MVGKHFKKKKVNIFKFLILVFVLLNIISIIYISKWMLENKENKDLQDNISTAVYVDNNVNYEEPRYNIDFQKLKAINSDTVGWLKVKNTNIEYTVVQADNNNYYLKHNFEKKYNNAGWIFADYNNKFDGTDKNLVIYGHNRKNNSMFGSLKNALKEEWYSNNENLTIDFVTESGYHKYQIFSVHTIESEEYYIDTEFEDDEFEEFIITLKSRSIIDFNTDISKEDNILTLSTCDNSTNDRVVLHAKRVYKQVF